MNKQTIIGDVRKKLINFGCEQFVAGKFPPELKINNELCPALMFSTGEKQDNLLVVIEGDQELKEDTIDSLQALTLMWAKNNIGLLIFCVPNIKAIKCLQCSNVFADYWVLYDIKPEEWWFEDKSLVFIYDDEDDEEGEDIGDITWTGFGERIESQEYKC